MDTFEQHRSYLFGIAYRMMGSAMEAEDAVQEAYLRYQDVDEHKIKNPRAFLSTVVTRICLDQLKSARAQREEYYGPWLPEPILMDVDSAAVTPAKRLLELESISMAFLTLMEKLSPTERAVFLLREVFDYDYAEIAEIVQKSEATCRQLLSRAKRHISTGKPRFDPSPENHTQLLQQFIATVQMGDMDGLTHLLAEEVALYSDGGGKAHAATRPLYGRDRVSKFIVGLMRFYQEGMTIDVQAVNGQPGIIIRHADRSPIAVLTFEIGDGKIYALRNVLNPDKLEHLHG